MATETMNFRGYEYARRDAAGEVIDTGRFDELWLGLQSGEVVSFRAVYATNWVDVTRDAGDLESL